ncbi:MAG: 16S rRNA (guanine(527)-N(7))-methyltransferase RsmG [Chloroflexota bacterium]
MSNHVEHNAETKVDMFRNLPSDIRCGQSDRLSILREGCEILDIQLNSQKIIQFEQYYHLLADWNKRINLTSITTYEDVQSKHFLDSLVSIPLWTHELAIPFPLERPLHLVDVGTGPGFPGIPLKIVEPSLKVTLIDGTGKKIRFLQEVVQQLGLEHVQVVQGRAEELGRQPAYRGQFDLVTARAVAPLNTLVEYLLPLCRRGGLVVAYKGANAAHEFVAAQEAIAVLGGETARFAPVEVPTLTEKRTVCLIAKNKRTPAKYPRGQGLARKKPLGG